MAQDPITLEPKLTKATIISTIAKEEPQRLLELIWFDGARLCSDEITLKANRKNIKPSDNVTFRLRIRRKCGDSYLAAPVPVKAVFVVKNLGSKSAQAENRQESQPSSSQFAFEYQFKRTGKYMISVINYYNENETHTINLQVEVNLPEQIKT